VPLSGTTAKGRGRDLEDSVSWGWRSWWSAAEGGGRTRRWAATRLFCSAWAAAPHGGTVDGRSRCGRAVVQLLHDEALARRAHVGDQTGQESRSAGHRAAARVTATNIERVDLTHESEG
jgi:hypothetical protein